MAYQDISKLKLLVVDDDEFILNLSARILGKIGCENVTTVSEGKHAIEEISVQDSRYDIIISDLNMPVMDGVELLRHIAGVNYTGGIILLSGEDERILETALDLARSHSLYVLGALPKPLRPDALKKLLESFQQKQKPRTYQPQEPVTINELREGMTGAELQLVYQPKVRIQNSEICGVEALARWNHPERGLLGPGAFIPIAEQNGLIDELTYAIYKKATRQAGEWLASGVDLHVSINVSINTFTRPDFAEFLIAGAQAEGVEPSRLILEVTESQVMSDAKGCLEKIMHLRMKKFGLSIDDFGTGHSSMAQLMQIPFTELKIDRAFVFGAMNNSSARAILESSVSLGRKLKMSIVAEGVETREDWDVVAELGCDFVQGYYVAKPMPENALVQFINGWSGPN